MFIINGEPLHESTHPKEFKWMNQKIKEIKNCGKKQFTYRSFEKRTRVLREDGVYVPQKNRKRVITMIGSTEEAIGVRQEWAYAASQGALKDDGSGRYTLRRKTRAIDHETVFSVDHDFELIFFFEYLCNNRHVKKIDYELINKQEAQSIALRSKAESLIYSPDSPVHPDVMKSEKPLRNISLSWGIGNALEMDIFTLMRELWSKVQFSESNKQHTNRGYKEFIDDVLKYGDGDKRAVVTRAIQEGILEYDSFLWKMKSNEGEQFLCGVPTQEDAFKDDYIMEYVLTHEPIYLAVESILNNPKRKKQTDPKEGEKKRAGNERSELLKQAKDELGWSGENYRTIAKMNKEELQELIGEGRRPEPLYKE